MAGQWGRRESGGRSVLAQTKETQPWAVALLEDTAFTDVDVSVRFRPISGIIGLWTKADSVTEFADLTATGTAAP